MSKMSELDRVLRELKKCGESLAGIAEELAGVLSVERRITAKQNIKINLIH